MKSSSINKSIPTSKMVRGYTISRMPIGQSLKALQVLQDLPELITKTVFNETACTAFLTAAETRPVG